MVMKALKYDRTALQLAYQLLAIYQEASISVAAL
jgi:hypothetical protein